jgi:hypothetical protein
MKNRVPLFTKIASNEKGFAIPIAMGMGLIMVLLATTAIVRSQDDQVTAIGKKDAARSRIAAEAGVNQIMGVINKYRALSGISSTSWTVAALPTNINNDCTTNATIGTAKTDVVTATSGWLNVLAGGTTQGEYRVVSYQPTLGGGDLTVEGSINRGTTNEAISRIQVQFPTFDVGGEQVPALWSNSTISGTPQIDGDVLGNCTTTTLTASPVSPHVTSRSRMTMPDAPDAPTGTATTPSATPPASSATTFYALPKISTIANRELPRTGTTPDVVNTDGFFWYTVTAANFDDSFKVTAGKKVKIWVNGNIDLSSKTIVNQCGGLSACGPFDVRIYGGASGNLTLNPYTRVCDVFLHLKNYDATYNTTTPTGTAPTQDCGGGTKNTGVYWVNSWTGGVSGTTLIDEPRARWNQSPADPTDKIGPITNWTALQVP